MAWLVGFLVLTGMGACVGYFLKDAYNPGFPRHPAIVAAHVILGGIYMAVGAFQFVPRIRERAISYHRQAGRALAAIGTTVGASAFFIAVVIPFSGLPEQIIVGGFAIYFTLALLIGVSRVRAGRIAEHREWMMRAYSIGLSIATMRLIFIPALAFAAPVTLDKIEFLSISAFTVSFMFHLIGTELWLRRDRVPALA
jgi:uncharacterized membrane protein